MLSENVQVIPDVNAGQRARTAVIDIGSNTVRLVIFDGAPRSPSYFFNEKVYCGLGADLERTGLLSPEGRERALEVIRRFALLVSQVKIEALFTVATAAIRDAEDGPAFCEEVERTTGIKIRVLTGEEEGEYAAFGVLLGEHRAEGVVVDIGGASMELATVRPAGVGNALTTPLGPLRLHASGMNADERRTHISEIIAQSWPKDAPRGAPLYLVGGGWRALAKLMIRKAHHALDVLHGYQVDCDEVLEFTRDLAEANPAKLSKLGISKARAANAPATAEVLTALIEHHAPSAIIVSACGLREGLIYAALPEDVRKTDPLLGAARLLEQRDARFPGQGEALAAWLAPVLPEMPRRLLLTACLLADVKWRTHPDYRAASCFMTATETSLLGLTHRERMILAVSLAHRYKGARSVLSESGAMHMLQPKEAAMAEACGKLIRLAGMAAGMSTDMLLRMTLGRNEEHLSIWLPEDLAHLVSPALEARLRSAAQALNLSGRLIQGSGGI